VEKTKVGGVEVAHSSIFPKSKQRKVRSLAEKINKTYECHFLKTEVFHFET